MPKELLTQVSPEVAVNEQLLKEHISRLIKVSTKDIQHISILKRSVDARQKAIKINLKVLVFFQDEEFTEQKFQLPDYKNVEHAREVIVV
ncbi:MAG: FAD-binding protein, partial [Flavobacterium sp.]